MSVLAFRDDMKPGEGGAPLLPVAPGKPVAYGSEVYARVAQFLIDEAYLLDDDLLDDWLGLMAEDILYVMPVRRTVKRSQGKGVDPNSFWFYEDYASLKFKTNRFLRSDSAFAEDPPSRTRRFVANVRAFETATADEYVVQSYLQINRSRGDLTAVELLCARRDDLIRATGDGLKLARRTILYDQSVVGTPNLAIFL